MHIARDHFQLKTVIQRCQNLFLCIAEVWNLIGGRKERNDRNIGRYAFVGIAAFVQYGQQRVQNAITGFENFVKKHNMCIWNFPFGNSRRCAFGQKRQTFLVLLHSLGELFQPCRSCSIRRIRLYGLHNSVQLLLHLLIMGIFRKHLRRYCTGNQARQIKTTKQRFFVCLLGKQAFKLSCTGNALAKLIDCEALGLSGITQNKQVAARQERHCNRMDQFCTLGNFAVQF